MKLYADLPGRRATQIAADLSMLAWVAGWIWVGRTVHDATLQLAAPGRTLEVAGTGFTEQMRAAGAAVGDLPLIGDRLAAPFESIAGVGGSIQGAGTDLIAAVTKLAWILGLVTALTPVLIVGALWLWRRGRFARRASAAARFIDSAADLDLFALRAMAGQPMHKLAAISPDPAGDWRRGEVSVITALAHLELRDCGLRPPPATAPGGP